MYEIKIHFGDHDSIGSEHSIGGKKFPLEVSNQSLSNKFGCFMKYIQSWKPLHSVDTYVFDVHNS